MIGILQFIYCRKNNSRLDNADSGLANMFWINVVLHQGEVRSLCSLQVSESVMHTADIIIICQRVCLFAVSAVMDR